MEFSYGHTPFLIFLAGTNRMRTLIYQYWNGKRPEYTYASEELFREYSKRIGADYLLGDGGGPIRCLYKRYFGALLPIYSEFFWNYDYVLYVDMDVIPMDALFENIFDHAQFDFMMSEETEQPEIRSRMKGNINSLNDKIWMDAVKKFWNIDVDVDYKGRPLVYNSGVVLYSNAGMRKMKSILPPVLLYQLIMKLKKLPRFYSLDQNYLNSFKNLPGVGFGSLDRCWNSQVTRWSDMKGFPHLEDHRTENTKFVHLQHGSAKNLMSKKQALDVAISSYKFKI